MPALLPRDAGLVSSQFAPVLTETQSYLQQPPSDAVATATNSPKIIKSPTTGDAVLHVRAPASSGGFVAIPTTYSAQSSSPAPGIVVGIVLGSVGGFMLLIALLYSCSGWRPVFVPWRSAARVAAVEERTVYVEEERRRTGSRHAKRKSKRHSHRHSHRPRRRGSFDEEMFEVRTAARAVPVHHVPVAAAAAQPPPPMMPGVRVSQTTTTTRGAPRVMRDDVTTSDTTEDEVVVIEEHSPPRHKSSHRSSGGRRSHDSRRASRRYS